MNKLSGQTVEIGDVLLDIGKLDKAIRIRLGSGGVAVGTSEVALTGPYGILPAQALVLDVYVNVLVASTGTTKTLNLGLLAASSGGSRTGFLNSVDVSTTGLKAAIVAGGTSGGGTYGAFLTTQTTGNAPVQKSFASDSVTAKTLSYTPNSSDWALFSADVYICYVDFTR